VQIVEAGVKETANAEVKETVEAETEKIVRIPEEFEQKEIMASSKLEPPEFCSDASGYAEYRKKLGSWSRITTVKKGQQN